MRIQSALRASVPRFCKAMSVRQSLRNVCLSILLGSGLVMQAHAVPVSADPDNTGGSTPDIPSPPVALSALKSDLLMIRANAASPALAALAPSGGSTAASPFFIGAAGPLLPAGNMSPWTVWSDVRTGTFSDDAAVADTKGDFAQGNIGIGIRLTGETVAGVVATAERVSEREGGSGNALHRKMFAIGPYLAAELAPGLAFETRAQWGWSDDEMHRDSGASLFKGSREAQHGMVEARLSAERDMGDVHITADAALFYGRDTLGSALLDDGSTTQTLAGGSEELGRASLGFAAEHAFAMEGATLSPYAAARLSWDFIQPEPSADALRLSTSVGMRYESGAFAATAGIDWDGVATRGLQSVAARLTVTQGF